MATSKQPSIEQMIDELRQRAVGPKVPLTPIDTAKRNLEGMYESAKRIPGNIQRMIQDPVAYAKSIPAPTGDQIMNALGPGNVGMAGIMIGPKAKTWNAGNASKAEAMEKAGMAPEEIWYATGTYRGPEGKWRQEIDDSKAVHRMPYEIKQKAQQLQDQQAMLKVAAKESLAHGKEVVSDLFPKEAVAARKAAKQHVNNIDAELDGYFGLKQDPRTRGNVLKHGYEHPELYAAYPELADYVFKQGNDAGVGTLGSLNGRDVNLYLEGLGQKNPGSTVAHELQHAIQDIEGLPRGGNVYEFMRARQEANEAIKGHNDALSYIAKRMDEASDPAIQRDLKATYDEMLERRARASHYTHIDPYQQYKNLGGEAESRMIQERLNMTPEERAKTFPMGSYDVNPKNLRLLDQGEKIDIYKAQGGTVKLFDYENPEHIDNVAKIAAKHKDFSQIPGVAKHLADSLSQGSYKFIEDPRIQSAIKQAGHKGYFFHGKDGKQQIVNKADGGVVPSMEQIKAEMMSRFKGLGQMQSIGANEAPGMAIKAFVPTSGSPDNNRMPVGGVDTSRGPLPVGGIDMNKGMPGQQMQPAPAGDQPGMDQMPQGDKMPDAMPGVPSGSPSGMPPGTSNILNMTPQGQAMAAMKPQGLADGGQPSIDQMKSELAEKKDSSPDKRITVTAPGAGGVKGIVVPKHLIEGNPKANAEGLKNMMNARAKVYGEEHREPINLGQMGKIHKQALEEHFAKPLHEQKSAEQEALNKIRSAKFIKHNRDTLDESEKLDTVEHEHDEQGRSHVGYASKGIAGHALFPKGHGKDMDYKVINTCPGQTEGCGGGKSAEGIVDTKQGTCFAPNAESQYAAAVSRRAGHAIAKHDPAMTKDWIIAHTGSMRNAANKADKQNKRMLYRPNVVDETDVSSRHVIRHLNEQRKIDNKPPIIANSYGKTNELHDPENGYHVTHSNVGPKVKKGQEIKENIGRDKARVRNTVMAADNQGDFRNEQGNKTPPKGSYMVTDVKRGSPMAKTMEQHITHAKYWTTGRAEHELTDEEKKEGPEGHFSGSGRKTSEDKAHYGHTTHEGLRYDYQKQHILHPRLVQVGKNDDGTPHIIPTDSRFKDTEFLPKDRFKTKNGKEAGHILMTTPTESTDNIGHQTSFTHNVSDKHIEHAKKNNGEYEIDKPEDQAKAKGKEYAAPMSLKFYPKPKTYAIGGSVGGRHIGFSDDDYHAFPEQNVMAQRHLAMRRGDDESHAKHGSSGHKRKVTMANDMDTMMLELTRNKKAK